MEAVLSGRDSLLVLPTGGGKSLCFQAPAIASDGLAIVVSPLISLMKDQVDYARRQRRRGGLLQQLDAVGAEERSARGVRDGNYRLLYVAPERLVGRRRRRVPQPAVVAADQLHRRRTKRIASASGGTTSVRSIASSRGCAIAGREDRPARLHATATARVRRDIVSQLGLRNATELVGSFDRPNLVYRVLARSSLKAQILEVLERIAARPASSIARRARKWTRRRSGCRTPAGGRGRITPGMADEERHRNQDAFLNEEIDLVVATVAFGMGIDRSDVRFVIHAGAPQSLEHYQQESGRAGRDGLEPECVLIASGADFLKWRMMLEKNGELSDARRGLLRDMERYAASVGCRHKRLVSYFGETFTKEDCGACDYCLGELEAVPDAITVARKVLSCVARVGQRFGAAHVTNVLRGSDSEQVRSRGTMNCRCSA
jgi:ATP-dependent DNA helicase RecQ